MASKNIDFNELWERIKDHRTAMFTTVSQDGMIHSRPMMTQEREADMDLWFVSSLNTEKIDEIKANPKIGVLYYRDADNAYVSIAGTAEINTDKALIRSKWKEDWKVWFPEGPDQTDIALIKVTPIEAEYWEPKGGKLTVMFEMARGYITGEHPELNEPVEGKVK